LVGKPRTEELIHILASELPPEPSALAIIELVKSFPSTEFDNYLLSSLEKCNEPGWSHISRIAIQILPGRLGVELESRTQARIERYWEDQRKYYYSDKSDHNHKLDDEGKTRLDVSWGFVCSDVWNQCRKK
jgi:hypothetical protein